MVDFFDRFRERGFPKQPKMDKAQALAVVPVRNPLVQWERKDGEVLLTVPMRNDALARIARMIVRNVPGARQLSLDEVGSQVWELIDGRRNVNSVIEQISSTYKLTRREAEASVTLFLQMLAKRNLIGLMSPKASRR